MTAAAPVEALSTWMALRQTHAPRRRGRPGGSPFWPVQEDVRGHAARLDAPIDIGFFAKLRSELARDACATSASAGRPEGPETKCLTITFRRKVYAWLGPGWGGDRPSRRLTGADRARVYFLQRSWRDRSPLRPPGRVGQSCAPERASDSIVRCYDRRSIDPVQTGSLYDPIYLSCGLAVSVP